MDHKNFIASLSTDQRQSLTEKSNAKGLIHFTVHAGSILLVGTLIHLKVPTWQLLMVLQGILLIFLFTLLHETLHSTVFQNKHLNTYVGYLCGFLIIIPPLWFRYFHFAHHRYTQNPDKDPELASIKPETIFQYLSYLSGIPTWLYQIKTLFLNAKGKTGAHYIPQSKGNASRVEGSIMIKLYILILVLQLIIASPILLYTWLLPLIIGQPFLRLYLLAEHGHCPMVENMFANTRTTYTSWFVRKLAWNTPFHAEHHAMPNVPFHALPKLHSLTKKHLQSTEDGYKKFNQTYLNKICVK